MSHAALSQPCLIFILTSCLVWAFAGSFVLIKHVPTHLVLSRVALTPVVSMEVLVATHIFAPAAVAVDAIPRADAAGMFRSLFVA